MRVEKEGEPGFVLKEAIREMDVGERQDVAKSTPSKKEEKEG